MYGKAKSRVSKAIKTLLAAPQTAALIDRCMSWWARAAHSRALPLAVRQVLRRGRIVDVPNVGLMRLNGYDHTQAFPQIFGVWEPGVERLARAFLRAGDTAIDVGANVGYYTLLMARAVGPSGHVFAFEPSPVTIERLRENVHLNRLDNVTLFQTGASDHRGLSGLSSGSIRNQGRSSMVRGSAEYSVPVAPLDELIEPTVWSRTRLVKIDVEGAESSVIDGMHQGLERLPNQSVILLELSGESEDEYRSSMRVFERLMGLGFDAYIIPNRYDFAFYLNPGTLTARRTKTLPRGATNDFAFVRGYEPRIGYFEA